MEDKMNAIDAADEAEYNRVQSVLAQRARQSASNASGTKLLMAPIKDEPLNWWEKLKSTFTLIPSVTSTLTPSITPTPSKTPTQTPSPTKTPLPTPTTDNINIAISYLQYSPRGLELYKELHRKANKVTIDYSDTTYGAMIPTPVVKEYLFGLIKINTSNVTILVNPQQSPTFIAGTIAHESYHFLTPGGTGLEEYSAYRTGDGVRDDIVQAGYGTSADMFAPLSDYTVNTNNQNLGQLIEDLDKRFYDHRIPDYASDGDYGMDPLPNDANCYINANINSYIYTNSYVYANSNLYSNAYFNTDSDSVTNTYRNPSTDQIGGNQWQKQ